MNRILLGFSVLLLVSSCSKFQYVSMSSDLTRSPQRKFVHENDSLVVTYSIKGQEGEFQVDIFNKLIKPIFVDWSKSSIIINNVSVPYWKNEFNLNAETQGYRSLITQYPSSTTQGTLSQESSVSAIPPRSSTQRYLGKLRSDFFAVPSETSQKITIQNQTQQLRINARQNRFEKEKSPLTFRSYLTISATEDFKHPVFIDNQFWVNEVLASHTDPSLIGSVKESDFYIQKPTQFGTVLIGTAALIVLVFAVLAN